MDTVHFHPFPCYYYFFKELPQSDLIPTRLLHLVAPFYYSLIIIIVFTTKTAVFHRKINLCLLLIYNSYGLKSLYMYSKPLKHFYIFCQCRSRQNVEIFTSMSSLLSSESSMVQSRWVSLWISFSNRAAIRPAGLPSNLQTAI